MRSTNFIKNEYYLLKSSGVAGSSIFIDQEDILRFLFLLLYLQSPIVINNVGWYVASFIKKNRFGINSNKIEQIHKEREVELLSFKIQEGEFSLVVHNLEDGVASVYMQRVLTGYSKYFNSKYKKRGHVFQGPFLSKKIPRAELKKTITDNHKTEIEKESKIGMTSREDYQNKQVSRWSKLLKVHL